MQRLRVGLAALVLLLGGAEQSRADFLFPAQISNLSGAGPFSYPPDSGIPLSGSLLLAEALHHHIQVFLSTGLFVTRFSNMSSGYEQIFELGRPARASLLDPLTWPSFTHGNSLMNPGSVGVHEEQNNYAFASNSLIFADILIGEAFNHRGGTSRNSDPFLASMGVTLGETQPAEPGRVLVLAAPPNTLSNRKVWLSLIIMGVGGLATASLVWRQRKHSPYRAPGGRRPIAAYRSTGLPNPRGTISSPPP